MNKKLRLGMVALTTALMLAGCGGKSDPGNQPLSTTQKNEAYTTLRTMSSKPIYNPTSNSGSQITVNVNMGLDAESDFSKSGLSSTAIDSLESNMMSGFLNMKFIMGAKIISGYKPDGTGYQKTYGSLFGIQSLISQEITKKEGTEYFNYYKDDETKIKSKVDESYASNMYTLDNLLSYDEEDIFSSPSFSQDDYGLMQEILEVVTQNETYDDFILDSSALSKTLIMSGGSEGLVTTDGVNLDNVTTIADVDITLTDGVYELKVSMEVDDYLLDQGTDIVKMDMDSDISIKFDKNAIKSIKMDVGIENETTMKCSDVLDGSEYNVTFTDNNTVTQNTEVTTSISLTTDAFNEGQLTQSLTGYTGTGENGEVENKKANITFKCVNLPTNSALFEDCYSGMFGTSINNAFTTVFEDSWYNTYNLVPSKLYWDEECLDEVLETDVIPSYDATFYYKVNAEEGKGFAQIKEVWKQGPYTSSSTFDKTYNAGATITFADLIDEGTISEVKVNGTVVFVDSITVVDGAVYVIEISFTKD